MKKLLIILASIFILFSWINIAEAWIFSNDSVEIPYCEWNECWLKESLDLIKNSDLDWVILEWTASDYIQRVIVYVLTFLKLTAVIIIIYAWFNMLTAAWDEEKAKKSKTMIVYAIIWLAIIYLAGPITTFVLNVFSQG